VVPALAPAVAEDREVVLVDVGTGAGLGLHLDRYRYRYASVAEVGPQHAAVTIETAVRGTARPPVPATLPRITDRVGIDIEPLDVADEAVRRWLAACIPQEIGAVTRFHRAVEVVLANPARTVRGDACAVLPDVLAAIPEGPLVCVVDTYVSVFFTDAERRRLRVVLDAAGARRDLDWISIDPLVPMGDAATDSVLGEPAPAPLVERNHREGVFGAVARLSYRGGRRSAEVLGAAHPGAAWLEWL
jgi:hypothetical protein